jgi:hypothetical protein
MAATLGLFVYSGTNGATESSGAVTGISFFGSTGTAADLNTLGARQADPITVGSNSVDKQLRLKITAAPANAVTNFKFWTDGSGTSNVALRAKVIGTGGATPGTGGATPSTTALTGDADAYTYTSGSKLTWDSASYSSTGNVTKALQLQLQPNASASAGNWPQETLNYSYDET